MWAITIQIQGKPIAVIVHTDAEVTVKSHSTWKSLNFATPLEETFHSSDQTHLKMFPLIHHGRYCTQDAYIIKDLNNDLLGLPAIKELEIIVESMLSRYHFTVSLVVYRVGNFSM